MNAKTKSRNRSTKSKQTNKKSNLSKAQLQARKKSRKRAKRQGLPRSAISRQKMYLSKCSQDYLEVLSNPFGSVGAVCIPDLYDQQSAKYRIVAKGTLVTGTANFGFIQIMPQWCAANNGANVFYSSDETTFITSVTSTSAAGITANSFGSAPYASASIAAATPIKSRIVGLGVRVRYIGTELTRGGRMVLLRKPYNTTTDGKSTATALSDRTAISLPVNRRWVGVNYLPNDSEDYEYQFSANFENNPRLAILIDSPSGNQFEYEAIAYIEYVGTVANLSPSHSDVTGMSTIREAINKVNTVEPAGPGLFNSLLSSVTNFGSDVLSHPSTVAFASNTAQEVVRSYL
jgi:hypothetical protein